MTMELDLLDVILTNKKNVQKQIYSYSTFYLSRGIGSSTWYQHYCFLSLKIKWRLLDPILLRNTLSTILIIFSMNVEVKSGFKV